VLAQALLPLLDDDQEKALASGQAAIDAFPDLFQAALQDRMLAKLGITHRAPDDDVLMQDLLTLLQEEKTDFTLAFRHLSDLIAPETASGGGVGAIFELPDAFDPWLNQWQQRLGSEPQNASERQAGMYIVNPAFIPRNHLVEEAIDAATRQKDFGPFNQLVDLLSQPDKFDKDKARYATPPRPEQVVSQTFCGT